MVDLKALVYNGRERMAVEERDVPSPARGEVLVRVAATGICGSDLHGFMRKTARRTAGTGDAIDLETAVDRVHALATGHDPALKLVIVPDDA